MIVCEKRDEDIQLLLPWCFWIEGVGKPYQYMTEELSLLALSV